MVLRACALILVLGGGSLGVVPAGAEPRNYPLGPQDTIKLRVSEWRTASNDLRDWPAMSGEFTIGAAGTVAVPLLGEVSAAGFDPGALAGQIADRLWKKVGLVQRPDVAIEVARYRPFYILGDVSKPGAYPYAPDMRVVQALSIAGGALRGGGDSPTQVQREALSNRGEWRELATQKASLTVRQARLEAESRDLPSLVFPADILAREGDPVVKALVAEETSLWETRRSGLRSQLASLDQTQDVLRQEVAAMTEKGVNLAHQAELAEAQLNSVKTLVSKGYAAMPRQVELEQSAAQFASQRVDLDIATLRVKQDINAAERSERELKDQRTVGVLNDLHDTRALLAKTQERIATVRALIDDAETALFSDDPGAMEPERRPLEITISRTVEGALRSTKAEEGDLIAPGDTIRVVRPLWSRIAGRVSRDGAPADAATARRDMGPDVVAVGTP